MLAFLTVSCTNRRVNKNKENIKELIISIRFVFVSSKGRK